MTDTLVDQDHWLRTSLAPFNVNSKQLKTTISNIEAFGSKEINELLSTARYFYSKNGDEFQFLVLNQDEIDNLKLEINELLFKIYLKNVNEWKYQDQTIAVYATTNILKVVIFYLYYGYNTELIRNYIDYELIEMRGIDFEHFNVIYNISGPTVKEVLRPMLTEIKIRLFE